MNEILNLFLIIIVVGVSLWVINTLIPMVSSFKALLNLFAMILVVIYILQTFDIIPAILPQIRLIR